MSPLSWRWKFSPSPHSLYSSSIGYSWSVNIKLWTMLLFGIHTFSVSRFFFFVETLDLMKKRGWSPPWAITWRMGEGAGYGRSEWPFQSVGRFSLGWYHAWKTWIRSSRTKRPSICNSDVSPTPLRQLSTFLLHRRPGRLNHRPRRSQAKNPPW